MSKSQQTNPLYALNKLSLVSATLDELSDLSSMAYEGDGGLAGTLRLVSEMMEECETVLYPFVKTRLEADVLERAEVVFPGLFDQGKTVEP